MVSAFSFGTSQRGQSKKSSEEAPGPGEYQSQRFPNRRPPAWGFGTSNRNQNKYSNTPGAGQYEEKDQTVKRSFPKYQFGIKILQSDVGKGITPGPGTYEQESKTIYKTSSQYSFGLKVPFGGVADKVRYVRDNPGPATYETNYSTIISRPSSKVGNQQRGDLYNASYKFTPGVGSYNIRPSTSGPQHRFGTGNRDGQFLANQNPGPGTYQFSSTLRQTQSGKSIGGRHTIPPDDRFYVPGPGEYESYVEQTKRYQPKIRIGTAKRRELNQNEKNVPGPGTYQSGNIDKKRPPSYKYFYPKGFFQIGLELNKEDQFKILKLQDQEHMKGHLKLEMGKQFKFNKEQLFLVQFKSETIRKRFKPNSWPLRLQPDIKLNQHEASFMQVILRRDSILYYFRVGSESREKVYNPVATTNPGPDYYNLKSDTLGPKYGFGTEKRGIFKGEEFPGPGTYDIPPYFANVPGYLIPQSSNSQFNKTK